MEKTYVIAVDFDGTIVTHEYPAIGKPVPRALQTLKRIQEAGHKIILWTMRDGDELRDAVLYLNENGINLYGINDNPAQDWSTSPKAYANIYIDDAALGCPTNWDAESGRPVVNWLEVATILERRDVLLPR